MSFTLAARTHTFELALIKRNERLGKRLRALTIKGTRADKDAVSIQVNDEVVLFRIIRLDLAKIKQEGGTTRKKIPMPYEIIVLDIMR